jgi:hypothetical protein
MYIRELFCMNWSGAVYTAYHMPILVKFQGKPSSGFNKPRTKVWYCNLGLQSLVSFANTEYVYHQA